MNRESSTQNHREKPTGAGETWVWNKAAISQAKAQAYWQPSEEGGRGERKEEEEGFLSRSRKPRVALPAP